MLTIACVALSLLQSAAAQCNQVGGQPVDLCTSVFGLSTKGTCENGGTSYTYLNANCSGDGFASDVSNTSVCTASSDCDYVLLTFYAVDDNNECDKTQDALFVGGLLTSCSVDDDGDGIEYSCSGDSVIAKVYEGSPDCSGSSTSFDYTAGLELLYGDCIELTCGAAQLALKSVLVSAFMAYLIAM